VGAEEHLKTLGEVVRASGLVARGESVVALASGGADSTCLLAGLAQVCGPENVAALHLNYRLRDSSGDDERACRDACAALRVDLRVEWPELEPGNVQASARAARYRAAEELRQRTGLDWVATGHTRTDLAETVLYRLAASPGRRALLGMPARRGRLIRPLLGLSRSDTRRLARAAGLPFTDDPTNATHDYARNRIRTGVIETMDSVSPAFEHNVAETQAELAEETAVLDRMVSETLARAGVPEDATSIDVTALETAEPALVRLALRALAERAAGRPMAFGRARAAEIWRLAHDAEGGEVELGGGVSAICDHGVIRFGSGADETAEPPPGVLLRVPGSVQFGDWEVFAERRRGPVEPAGDEVATLNGDRIGDELTVRSWRSGDRITPLGLNGSKSLQDLFTDRKVPRAARRKVPVVTVGDEKIAWVGGLAVGEEFRIGRRTRDVVVVGMRPVQGNSG
jgi:tRNA(Ile)-lysidine synthase